MGNKGRVSVANRGVRTTRSVPAAPKPETARRVGSGRTGDLTKANVSPFSGHSFHKRVTARVGRAAPPSSTQRPCGYLTPSPRSENSLGVAAKYNPSVTAKPCHLPLHRGGFWVGCPQRQHPPQTGIPPLRRHPQSPNGDSSLQRKEPLGGSLRRQPTARNLSRRTDH